MSSQTQLVHEISQIIIYDFQVTPTGELFCSVSHAISITSVEEKENLQSVPRIDVVVCNKQFRLPELERREL